MSYEEMENEAIEKVEEIKEPEEIKEADDFPPDFSEKEEEEKEYPPSFGKVGETVEHRAKRHELESDIKRGLEIATENSLKELKELEKKEAEK